MKRTPWYPSTIKPARVGVYQRKYNNDLLYCFWDGKKWFAGWYSAKHARVSKFTSDYQYLPWRGLTSKAGT